ncbi:uncharacterized protein LOC105661782 isoform X2 [Megachile rotundata]|uniref:uncharacterized protein LOC105661782 isoform X2 n=1 Tax=Megachile rotundata TaxID=143995 RepID=UPI003FD10CE5
MEEEPDDITNPTDRINCLMNELMELKEMISKCKMERHYWELQSTTLLTSIWAGEVKYTEQQKMEAHLRTIVIDSNKLIDSKEQELKNLIADRTIYFSEQCDNFRIRNMKSADNILSAQKEYTIENLSKDIKQYREKDEKANKELLALRNKLIKLETDCDFNCLNLGQENDEILQINNVLGKIMMLNY